MSTDNLSLASGTACIVLGGSSITTLDSEGVVQKHDFYPKTVEDYFKGIVDYALEHGSLIKGQKGVLLVSAPGAFQNEGAIAGLPPSFHKVKEDAEQRGFPNLFFRQLLEEELASRGYESVKAYGYNDAVPALVATICQENTDEVLTAFEKKLGTYDRSKYAIKYMINGTGTGDATLMPDSKKVVTAEKGHLKPNLLWYQLNPLYKFATRFTIVGKNRTIERLVAGGPTQRSVRHFSKILKELLTVLNTQDSPHNDELSQILGFANYQELITYNQEQDLLGVALDEDNEMSLLQTLGSFIKLENKIAIAFRNAFAQALGSSMAYMNYVLGEMPDSPLNTFIGADDIRYSVLGFMRTDGSTTALLGNDEQAWALLNKNAQLYAEAILNMHGSCPVKYDHNIIFNILNINETFPNIHPDFGGLPQLAKDKLNKLLG